MNLKRNAVLAFLSGEIPVITFEDIDKQGEAMKKKTKKFTDKNIRLYSELKMYCELFIKGMISPVELIEKVSIIKYKLKDIL